jgi:hypothetical protein
MRDFHDWLRQRPSSLFMLFSCNLMSLASDHPVYLSGFGGYNTGVLEFGYDGPGLCCVWLWPICLDMACLSGCS